MARETELQSADRKKLQDERKKLKQEEKRQKKEVKKRAREIVAQEASLDDEESNGVFTFFATVAIVVVWLGIICIIIKLDVGGFGSGVLRPILKDVPVINLVLPGEKVPVADEDAINNPEGYTLAEALATIDQLKAELEQAKSGTLSKEEEIAQLRAEIVRLQAFESKQIEFQRIQTEFYEEVIYAENGPGEDAYRKYYEEMDPATAEYLYKQVVTQLEESKEIQDYANAYSSMKPKQAAGIFEAMTDNLDLVARILSVMNAEERGAILGVMDPEVAGKLTKIMDPES